MPLCTLHLLSLTPSTPLQTFLTLLKTHTEPLLTSRIIRWIILPKTISTSQLLAHNISWDLVILLPSTSPLPSLIQTHIAAQWTIVVGIPTKLMTGFRERNAQLLNPADPASVPKIPDSSNSAATEIPKSAQSLQLDTELDTWISSLDSSNTNLANTPITMLNLLSFLPGKKESYLQYGAAFGNSVGKKYGGNAKVVGTVVGEGEKKESEWNEVAFAQYPSLGHFRAMLQDAGYQDANQKWRLPALRDTFILCTSEVVLQEEGERVGIGKARL